MKLSQENKQPQVLLLIGNEERIFNPVINFARYIIQDAQIKESNVGVFHSGYMTKEKILQQVQEVSIKAGNSGSALILVYAGHGIEENFVPNSNPINYEELAGNIKFSKFLFINACCYAGNAITAFSNKGLLPHNGSVISMVGNEFARHPESFLCDLVASFKEGRKFMTRVGRAKIYGRIRCSFPQEQEQIPRDVVGSLDFKVEEESYSKPRTGGILYTSARRGISLDHLLFPPQYRQVA